MVKKMIKDGKSFREGIINEMENQEIKKFEF